MWTVVYIAANKSEAERLKARLQEEGILVSFRKPKLSYHRECCQVEILVPETEAEEAHEILAAALER